MRIPKTPPSIREILAGRDLGGTLATLLKGGNLSSPIFRGEYIHWDKLRHLAPLEGSTPQAVWAGLKVAREQLLKTVPETDKRGNHFRYCLPDVALEFLHKIDQGAGGVIEMPEVVTHPKTRDHYVISSLTEESIRSSQLEGAATTRKVAREMIRTGRRPRDVSEQMILNNFAAMQRIREIKAEALTPERVFEIHRILSERALDDPGASGRFRRADEPVRVEDEHGEVIHIPPPASELPERLQAMCDFANGRTPGGFVHPVVSSIILHFWLAYDHPFVDGNGRCARALFYWSMLRQRYWLCEFISISDVILRAPAKYYRSFLHTETDENDLTYFILYHLDVMDRAVANLHDYIQRKLDEQESVAARLKSVPDLPLRQRSLLGHALRHPSASYTIRAHQASHGVVYQTARTDLLELVDLGFLEMEKSGKMMLFHPAADLAQRLSAHRKKRAVSGR